MAQDSDHDALAMIEYDSQGSVLVFGDTPRARDRAARVVQRAGLRVADVVAVEDGAERLERQISADAILVQVDTVTPGLAPLLEKLQMLVRSGRRHGLVMAPDSLIDTIAACAFDVVHLCNPSEREQIVALAMAVRRPDPVLQDAGRNGAGVLQQLSEEAARIAVMLASLSDDEEVGQPAHASMSQLGAAPTVDASLVRSIIRARRLRDQYLRGGIFADPAWDMLLDLMAARLDGTQVAVSSLCIAAAVPATTALRWIKAMTERGLFVRVADPQDGRRVYIALSDEAATGMAHYLAAVQRYPVVT